MKNKKNKIIILILAIAVILVALKLFVFNNKKEVTVEKPKEVSIFSFSEEETDNQTLEFIGTLKATESVNLISEGSGKITEINIKEGSNVNKGQVIARLENSQEYLAYQSALNNLETQKINLKKLEKEYHNEDSSTYSYLVSQQEKAVKSAYQAFLNNDLRAYPDDDKPESISVPAPVISGTYQGDKEGQYFLEMYPSSSSSGYSIKVSGLEEGTYPVSTLYPTPLGEKGLYLEFKKDDDGYLQKQKWQIDIPNKRSSSYLTAKNAYENILKAKDLSLNQSEVSEDDIAQQKNIVNQMEIAVKQASLVLEKKNVVSPFNGKLVSFNYKIGDFVSAGLNLGSIKNLNNLEIEFFASPIEANSLSKGSKIYLEEKEIGSIYFISPALDEGGKIKVKADLNNNNDLDVKEGGSINFKVTKENSNDNGIIIVPLTAIQMVGNDTYLATESENKMKLVQVKTGLLLGEMIEIVDPSKEIKNFIIDSRGIKEGEKVTVIK
jgi:multidrug efflux pump subunit AcrA (membrane-fusion protein)